MCPASPNLSHPVASCFPDTTLPCLCLRTQGTLPPHLHHKKEQNKRSKLEEEKENSPPHLRAVTGFPPSVLRSILLFRILLLNLCIQSRLKHAQRAPPHLPSPLPLMGFRHEGLVSPTGSAFDHGDDFTSRPPAVVDRPFVPLHHGDGPVPPSSAASVKVWSPPPPPLFASHTHTRTQRQGKFVCPPTSSRWCAPVPSDSSHAKGGVVSGGVGDLPASSSALFHHQARRGSLGAPPAPPSLSHPHAAAAEAASFYPPAAVDVWHREAPPQQTRHVSPDAHAPETSHVSPARRPEWDGDADPTLPAAPSPHLSPPPALRAPAAAVSSAAMVAATASAASAALAVGGGGCDLQMQSEIVSLRSQVSELRSLVTSIIADKTEEKVEQAMLLRGFDPHAAGLALCHGGGVSPRAAPPGPSVSPRPAMTASAAAAAAAAPAPPPPLPQHLAYTGPSDVSVAARLRAQQHGQAPLSVVYEGGAGGAFRDAVGGRRAAAAAEAAAAAASHKPVTDYTPPVRGYGGGGAGGGGYGAGGHGRPTLESMYPVPPVAGLNSSRPVSEVLARRRSAEYEPRGPTGPVRGEDGLTVVCPHPCLATHSQPLRRTG